MDPEQKIQKYLSPIQQRTREWFEQRASFVTSSELGHLRQSIDVYRHYKLTPKSKVAPNACIFGCVFEPIAKQYLLGNTSINKIHETGFIPHPDKKIRLGASPDGIFFNKNQLWLLEIKCPIFRRAGTSIPDKYKDQMEAQLMCVPDAKAVHYYEFQFRICSKAQWTEGTEYNRWLHVGRRSHNPSVLKPLTKGVIEVQDNKQCDIGYGTWEGKTCEVDLAPLQENRIIYHNFTNHYSPGIINSSAVYWHLDNVCSTLYTSDRVRRRQILAMVDRKCVKDILDEALENVKELCKHVS